MYVVMAYIKHLTAPADSLPETGRVPAGGEGGWKFSFSYSSSFLLFSSLYPPPPLRSSPLSQGDSLAGAVFRGGRKGGGARIGKSSEGRGIPLYPRCRSYNNVYNHIPLSHRFYTGDNRHLRCLADALQTDYHYLHYGNYILLLHNYILLLVSIVGTQCVQAICLFDGRCTQRPYDLLIVDSHYFTTFLPFTMKIPF